MVRDEVRRIVQVFLLVVAVGAAAAAAWRYVASQEGEPTFAEEERKEVVSTPASGPVGTQPFLEPRGWRSGAEVRVLFCKAGTEPEACAGLGTGTVGERFRGEPIPQTLQLPGGPEEVRPGTYVLRAGTGPVASLQVRGEFEVVPFTIGEAPRPRSYASVGVEQLSLGEPTEVARGAPCRVHFAPDDRLVVGRTLVDASTGVTISFPVQGTELAWSPEGDRLAYLTSDAKEIRMATAAGEEAVAVVREARGLISSLSWAAEGDRLAYVARSDPATRGGPGPPTVFTFNTVNGETVALGGGEAVAWSPASRRLAVETGGGIEIWDLEGGRRPLVSGRRPAFSPDGNLLAFLRSGEVWVTRTDDPAPMRWLGDGACGVAFSAEGRRLAIATEGDAGAVVGLRNVVIER